MAKPGLLDTLLNRPSQKYSFPASATKEYYSTKAELVQVARALSEVPVHADKGKGKGKQTDETETDSETEEVFYTPNSSPRSSVARRGMRSQDSFNSTSSPSASDDSHDSLFSSPGKSSDGSSTARTSVTGRQSTYTDEDWAVDAAKNGPQHHKPPAVSRSAPTSRSSSPHRTTTKSHVKKNVSKTTPSIMMSMTALLEMDESAKKVEGNGFVAYRPRSNVILTARSRTSSTPQQHNTSKRASILSLEGDSRYPALNTPPSSNSSHSSSPSPSHRHRSRQSSQSSSSSSRPGVVRRRSRSLENKHIRKHSSSASSAGEIPTTYTDTRSQLPSSGTAGYTSLTLPRAPMPSNLNLSRSDSLRFVGASVKSKMSSAGKIDLTKSGAAQTTMSTVEVVRGLSGSAKSGHRLTRMFSKKGSMKARSAVGSNAKDSPLAFTSHRKPPSRVGESELLIQVWAVGVDAVDARIVGLSLNHSPSSSSSTSSRDTMNAPVGHIPGRSFVGRVLERGEYVEAKDAGIRKGDWVVGLGDIRKSGALSEFITIDRHRVCRVPHPVMPNAGSGSPARKKHEYTLEELALLPLTGVPAYRAVRTFLTSFSESSSSPPPPPPLRPTNTTPQSHLKSSSEPSSLRHTKPPLPSLHLSVLPSRPRALILLAHLSTGALALQLLSAHGWRVTAHAPLPPTLTEERAVQRYMRGVERRVREWGAEEVVFDDGDPSWSPVLRDSFLREEEEEEEEEEGRGNGGNGNVEEGAILRVIERLVEEGDVFDAVLDTVGGKRIWAACERLLRRSSVLAVPETPAADGGEDDKSVMTSRSRTSRLARSMSFGGAGKKRKAPTVHGSSLPSSSSSFAGGKGRNHAQFTTVHGDVPSRPIPTPGDHFKAGLRALKPSSPSSSQSSSANTGKRGGRGREREVGYTWISAAQDVDFEGEDVGSVLGRVVESGVRPCVSSRDYDGEDEDGKEMGAVVPFERAPGVFVEGSEVLRDGGVVVVRVVP